jgi:hypothetical protein
MALFTVTLSNTCPIRSKAGSITSGVRRFDWMPARRAAAAVNCSAASVLRRAPRWPENAASLKALSAQRIGLRPVTSPAVSDVTPSCRKVLTLLPSVGLVCRNGVMATGPSSAPPTRA